MPQGCCYGVAISRHYAEHCTEHCSEIYYTKHIAEIYYTEYFSEIYYTEHFPEIYYIEAPCRAGFTKSRHTMETRSRALFRM